MTSDLTVLNSTSKLLFGLGGTLTFCANCNETIVQFKALTQQQKTYIQFIQNRLLFTILILGRSHFYTISRSGWNIYATLSLAWQSIVLSDCSFSGIGFLRPSKEVPWGLIPNSSFIMLVTRWPSLVYCIAYTNTYIDHITPTYILTFIKSWWFIFSLYVCAYIIHKENTSERFTCRHYTNILVYIKVNIYYQYYYLCSREIRFYHAPQTHNRPVLVWMYVNDEI